MGNPDANTGVGWYTVENVDFHIGDCFACDSPRSFVRSSIATRFFFWQEELALAPNKGNRRYTCPLFGPCYKGPPLPPSCLSQAVSKNALSFGADALGAIPGEGNLLAGVQLAAAGVGFVNGLVTKDATGAVGSVIGGQLTLVGASAEALGTTALKAVPVAGNLLSGFFAIRDIANGFSDYQACLAGH